MDVRILEKIGLTKNETLVYITLLELGTSKTGEILTKSNLNSGKIYEILESLKIKGLISESIINNVRNFTAAPPSQLLDYVEKKKQELDSDEKIIRSILPNLEKIRNIKTKEVKAVTYVGLRGIKTAADEALDSMKKGEEILAMGVTANKDKKINEFWKNWQTRRLKNKVQTKFIFSEKSGYSNTFDKMKHTKAKVLESFTPVTVDIFGNSKVLILNYEEPISCILIDDKNTTTSFRNFFYQMWKIAKK